jgi:hypothetical protein
MTRNPLPEEASAPQRFSLAWVVVSYFLVCGGVTASLAAYAATRSQDPFVVTAAMFVGAALGGFLAGRASPHRSYIEPVLAALLVVGSVVAFVYVTPLGRVMVEQNRDRIVRVALQLGGIGAVGGLLGAVVGEAAQTRAHGVGAFGWLIRSIVISAGALFAVGTAVALTILNEAAQAAAVQMWTGGGNGQPLVDEDRIALAAAVAGGVSTFLGGLVTQLGAPRRALLSAAIGAALVVAGALLAIGWAAGRTGELAGPAALFGAAGGVVALVGALLSYLVGRATGRLSRGPVPDDVPG